MDLNLGSEEFNFFEDSNGTPPLNLFAFDEISNNFEDFKDNKDSSSSEKSEKKESKRTDQNIIRTLNRKLRKIIGKSTPIQPKTAVKDAD